VILTGHYDVIVVGAGSMGLATGYFLGKLGLKTLLIDAHDPPHHFGSHHGETRMIRHAYGEGWRYVPLAVRAQELWGQLEKESGLELFNQTGVLCAGPPSSQFTKEVIISAEQFNLPIQVLTGEDMNNRWPGLTVPKDFIGCLEMDSGVLFSETCLKAYRLLGSNYGTTFLSNMAVKRIDIQSGGVIVRTDDQQFTANQVVVSAGAWSGTLLEKSGIKLPLTPVRKTVSWFECQDSLYNSSIFPAFSFDLIHEHYYGFPSFNGQGVKIGRHDGGREVKPDNLEQNYGEDPGDEGDVRKFLQKHMPSVNGKLKIGMTCLYTLTPDEHFIIDRHPEFPHVIIAAGFSGHGFKFSSVVGEIISELVTQGNTQYDISMFSLLRSTLA
jgi:N-methyl-L-tryptophan oxidase